MARVTTIPATISRFTAAPINEKKKRRNDPNTDPTRLTRWIRVKAY